MRTLRIVEGAAQGREIEVDGSVTLGRAGVDIKLEDPLLSRRHARIEQGPDGLRVTDLGSTNGTFVNGVRISEPTDLAAGDVVRVGETSLEVAGSQEADETIVAPIPGAERLLDETDNTAPLPAGVAPASSRRAGMVAGVAVVLIGLLGATYAFRGSESSPEPARDRAADKDTEASSDLSGFCASLQGRSKKISALERAPRRAWAREVRRARRVRTRTLAALVAQGAADETPAFVRAFRRTDSVLLRLQRALRPKASKRKAVGVRSRGIEARRWEKRAGRQDGLEGCSGLAL